MSDWYQLQITNTPCAATVMVMFSEWRRSCPASCSHDSTPSRDMAFLILTVKSEDDFLELKGFGQTMLDVLRHRLAVLGLRIKPSQFVSRYSDALPNGSPNGHKNARRKVSV